MQLLHGLRAVEAFDIHQHGVVGRDGLEISLVLFQIRLVAYGYDNGVVVVAHLVGGSEAEAVLVVQLVGVGVGVDAGRFEQGTRAGASGVDSLSFRITEMTSLVTGSASITV